MSTPTVPILFAFFAMGFGITGAMVVPFLSCLYILFLGLRSTRESGGLREPGDPTCPTRTTPASS